MLTTSINTTNINPPLTHSAVGIETPRKGTRCHYQTWFFCTHQKAQAYFFACVYSLWWAVSGNLRGLVATFGDSLNLLQSAAKSLRPFSGGLSPLQRIKPMKNQTTRANTAQNPTKTPLFSIYAHRQAIALGIGGALAMRFKRRFPDCIVKFSGFEGGAL